MKRFKRIAALACLLALFATICPASELNAEDNDTFIDPEYVQICEEVGAEYGIAPELLEAIIEHESAGQPNVTNELGCVGLCQIQYGVHVTRMQKLGLHDIYNPRTNITLAADILNECRQRYGDDLMMTLMCYSGTSHAILKAKAGYFSDYAIEVSERAEELERIHNKKNYSKYMTDTEILKNRSKED